MLIYGVFIIWWSTLLLLFYSDSLRDASDFFFLPNPEHSPHLTLPVLLLSHLSYFAGIVISFLNTQLISHLLRTRTVLLNYDKMIMLCNIVIHMENNTIINIRINYVFCLFITVSLLLPYPAQAIFTFSGCPNLVIDSCLVKIEDSVKNHALHVHVTCLQGPLSSRTVAQALCSLL